MELHLTEGFVTMPIEALVANLTYEEIGVLATFKGAFENALHDPEMKQPISSELDAKLKDERLLGVIRSLQHRGIFNAVTEGNKITLKFDLEKA